MCSFLYLRWCAGVCFGEKSAEENIWTQKTESNGRMDKTA